MKIFLSALLISFNAFSVSVISDLDDTIKITDAGNLGNATWNGIFTEKVFTGMPEFLQVSRNETDYLHVVTAGPKILRPRVKSLFRKFNIQYEGIHLRDVFNDGKLEFKVRTIIDLLNKNPGDVILLGDDVDKDPEVFDEVMKTHGDRILGAYVHTVTNRPISGNLTRYWTSMDLALKEHISGRLDASEVTKVVQPLLNESKLSLIIPRFAHCPTSAVIWEWQLQTVFMAEASELSRKLTDFCLRGK